MYEDYIVFGPYQRKDGRSHCVLIKHDKNNNIIERKTISYPRMLMEEKLGRPLEPYEDVHHIDGNYLNNALDNLALINHGDHQRMHAVKYHDKIAECEVCHKKFLWTAQRQRSYFGDLNRNRNRIISCSKSCSSYYGRQEQLNRNV